jgi:hypothetical protein
MRNARWIVLFALSGVLSTSGAAPPQPAATGGCPWAFNAFYQPGHPADRNGDGTICVWTWQGGGPIIRVLALVIDNTGA